MILGIVCTLLTLLLSYDMKITKELHQKVKLALLFNKNLGQLI